MHRKAEKVIEQAMPMVERIFNEGNGISGIELDAAYKTLKLAKCMYEIDIMRKKMADYDSAGYDDEDLKLSGKD